MAYKKIVVGTDGSETAARAVAAAAELARDLSAQLLIVSAYDPAEASEEKVAGVLDEAKSLASSAGVEAATEAAAGEPAEALIEAVESWAADLLLVGDRGMGAARKIRLGGVPDRVSHYAPCDILIGRTSRDRPEGYRKVLIGTDGSVTAFDAVRRGCRLAAALGAGVTLVYVGEEGPGEYVLAQTVEQVEGPADIETRVVAGDPADTILEMAETDRFDLVVVGNRGMSGARRFLIGSVPNKISHYSAADVLIARTTAKSLADLSEGSGGLIDYGGRRIAAYMDEEGKLHALSPRCTHMGCTVGWNHADKTWDCPCHGSRFDVEGEVIKGPASKALTKVILEEV